jgi:nicotinamide-nucleotide amidase
MPDTTSEISRVIGESLRARGLTIATAESCTGGAVAAAIVAISGASDYFPGGIVAYDAAVKAATLGVPLAIIEGEGVVSEACALAMARGARRVCGSDLALATTGIAGPGGAEPGKPVGLVYIALAWGEGVTCRRVVFPGDRAAVIAAATRAALGLAREWLDGAL